ncbi:hypothetical protein CKA32_004007 [Geitlerinema sp. FC II]|nr:hypothetical protein CKA32_004007 [Geitlerinema sp. FC II]
MHPTVSSKGRLKPHPRKGSRKRLQLRRFDWITKKSGFKAPSF